VRTKDPVLSDTPVGTLASLKKLGLKETQWGSCSRRELDYDGTIKNVGCLAWPDCNLPEKGTDKGFIHVGLRVTRKLSTGRMDTLHMTCNCEDVAERTAAYEASGMVVQVVARQGEKIKIRGSKNRDEDIPSEGKRRFVVEQLIDWEIPRRLQPDENPQMLDQALAESIARETVEQKKSDLVEAANNQGRLRGK